MAKTRSMSRKLASEEPAQSPPPLPAPARRTRGRPRRAPEQNAPATQQAAAATEQILPTTEQTALAFDQAAPTTETEHAALATEQAAPIPDHEINEAVTFTQVTRASRAATARAARIAQTTQATRPTRAAATNKVTKHSTTSKASAAVRTRKDKDPYAWMINKKGQSNIQRLNAMLEVMQYQQYDREMIKPHIANGGIISTQPWLGPRPPPQPKPQPEVPKSPSGRPLSMSVPNWRRLKATKKQEDQLEAIRQAVAREQKEAAEAAAREQKEADEAAAKEEMRRKREALVDEVMAADPSVRDRRSQARRQHYQQQGLPTPNSAKKRTASEMEETEDTEETREVQQTPSIATAREQVKRGFWAYLTSWVPRPWKRQRVEQTPEDTTTELNPPTTETGYHPPVFTTPINDTQPVHEVQTAPPAVPRSPGRTYKFPSPTPSEIAEDDAEQAAWEKAHGITYPNDDDEMKEASPVISHRRSPGRTFTMPLPTAEEEVEEAAEYEKWLAAGGDGDEDEDENEDVTMADASLLSAKPPSPAAATVAADDDFGDLVAALAAAQAADPSGPLPFLEQNLERLIGASGTGVLEASYAF